MKTCLFLLLSLTLTVNAIESQKPSAVDGPKSVFEKSGRDPFVLKVKKSELPPTVLSEFHEITLRGITVSAGQSTALLNGVVIKQGDSAMVKMGSRKYKVLCKEIRANSVLLQIEDREQLMEINFGETKEIDGKTRPID